MVFERLINRLIHKLWKPIEWDVRTDDRAVRMAVMRDKVRRVGLYRSRSYAHNSWQGVTFDGPRPAEAEAAYNGLRWTPDCDGLGLYHVADRFVTKVRDSRVAAQLAEIEARVERVANRWLAEVCADVGLTA